MPYSAARQSIPSFAFAGEPRENDAPGLVGQRAVEALDALYPSARSGQFAGLTFAERCGGAKLEEGAG
jgi:hypothetical protein